MLNEEGSTQLSKATANVYRATLFSAEILIVVAAIIFCRTGACCYGSTCNRGSSITFATRYPTLSRTYCAIKAHYAANAAGAAAAYGFPTYAALKASWPWAVRMVAC